MVERPRSFNGFVVGTLSVLLVLLGGCGDEGRSLSTQPSGLEAPSPETMERAAPAAEKTGAPAGLSAGEWKQVTAQIDADRLRFVWDEAAPLPGEDAPGAYRALHTGGSITAWLSADTLVVRPVEQDDRDEQEQWEFELALEGVGRAGQPSRPRLEPGRTTVEGNRLEIERGGVLEWYENTSKGLQHGFVVDQRPPADEMGAGELRVTLAARGGLIPQVEPGGREARFVDDAGESVLRYSGLLAWDARGEALEARMEARGERLDLVVDDADAVYPVTIDPFLNPEDQKLLASDKELDDEFGHSVSLSGTTLAVGASLEDGGGLYNSGAVYVFEHDGTSWVERQKLLASDKASDDEFGHSVSLSGTTLAVGARNEDSGELVENGAVYVFEHDGTSWVESQKLLASDEASSDYFGCSVSLSGTRLAVGAYGEDSGGLIDNGAAYVFEHDGTSWVEDQKLLASDRESIDYFGWSVSLSGTTLAVGAPQKGSSGQTEHGAVYVFEGNAAPVASDQAVTTDEEVGVTVTLSASDADGDALTYAIVDGPTDGALSGFDAVAGTATYTPATDFNGSDSFTFEANDGTVDSNTATVSITVSPVNDAPVFVAPTPADQEVLTVVEADTLEKTLAADDTDADTLTYDVAPLPSGASLDAATGAFSWTPTWQDAGTYQLGLSVTDGALSDSRQVTVEVSFIDADGDGLPDTWETANGLDATTDDTDGDGISDADEVGDDLDNPRDTDGDGVIDALDDVDNTDEPDDVDEPDNTDESLEGGRNDDGCGCSSASGPSSMLSVVFVLLGLIGLRVRRGPIARD